MPKSTKKTEAEPELHKGVRYIGTGIHEGHWCVFVVEPDGARREHYRSPQEGIGGRPFAFSQAKSLLEMDAGRRL